MEGERILIDIDAEDAAGFQVEQIYELIGSLDLSDDEVGQVFSFLVQNGSINKLDATCIEDQEILVRLQGLVADLIAGVEYALDQNGQTKLEVNVVDMVWGVKNRLIIGPHSDNWVVTQVTFSNPNSDRQVAPFYYLKDGIAPSPMHMTENLVGEHPKNIEDWVPVPDGHICSLEKDVPHFARYAETGYRLRVGLHKRF